MGHRLNWGILGTGNIARQFCVGVNASARGRLAAVGSRSIDTARAFAATHNVSKFYGSYDELLADPAVQAIYVSLPNTLHHHWALKALRAGKHVLCEKPITTTAAEAEELFDVAEKAGRILVEAFMYRSHPLTKSYVEAIRRGEIGEVKLIRASFCYRTTKIASNVRFSPQLAGGALMDVGCYCVSFARLIAAAEPTAVSAITRIHETGVDETTAGTLLFPGGLLASFTCGMGVQADNTASVCGSEGYVEIPVPWKPPALGSTYTLARATPPRMEQPGLTAVGNVPNSGPRRTITVDAGGDLYGIEADDFAATILDGAPPAVSRQDTVGNMCALEELRRQTGLLNS